MKMLSLKMMMYLTRIFSSETTHDAWHFQDLIEGTITLTLKLLFSDLWF